MVEKIKTDVNRLHLLSKLKRSSILAKYIENFVLITKQKVVYTVRNVQKLTKFLCFKGNIKFDDIYDVFLVKVSYNCKKFTDISLNIVKFK